MLEVKVSKIKLAAVVAGSILNEKDPITLMLVLATAIEQNAQHQRLHRLSQGTQPMNQMQKETEKVRHQV